MDMIQRRPFHAHAGMPIMKTVVDDWEQLHSIKSRGVGDAKCFGKNEQHEKVFFVALRAGERASIGRHIEFMQPSFDPRENIA